MNKTTINLFAITLSALNLINANNSKEFYKQKIQQPVMCRYYIDAASLKRCMELQDQNGFAYNFLNLDAVPLQRLDYLQQNVKKAADFKKFKEYFTEETWENIWDDLTNEEKEFFKMEGIDADSKENLDKIVKKKENEEFNSQLLWYGGGTCLVLGTGGLALYYYGPTAVSTAIGKVAEAAAPIVVPAAKGAAMTTGAIMAYKLDQEFDLSGHVLKQLKPKNKKNNTNSNQTSQGN